MSRSSPDARPDDGQLELGVVEGGGLVRWTRILARTAVGDPSASPFVRVTRANAIKAKLDRKVLYELDGGDRSEIKSFKVRVEPGALLRPRPQTWSGGELMASNPAARAGGAPLREARAHGESIARTPQFEWFARAGLAARGVVYIVIGVLAIKLALGDGGKATNQQGALQTIAKQPFGTVLLIMVAGGLAGYASWRLLRAAIGHGPEDADDAKERIDGLVSGIGYAGALRDGREDPRRLGRGRRRVADPDKATGGVLGWPGGTWLVAIAGAIIVGVGLEQGYKALKQKFLEDSKTGEMSHRVRQGFTALGVAGYLARMVVFALIGYFLIKAALDYDPDEGDRPRRRARPPRSDLVRAAPAGRRRRRPCVLRRLLHRRRALPEGLDRRGGGSRRLRAPCVLADAELGGHLPAEAAGPGGGGAADRGTPGRTRRRGRAVRRVARASRCPRRSRRARACAPAPRSRR